MVTLHESEVDGVRCFWVETGRPTLVAQLLFRQGMADEPLRESGWLHLIEHLALHGRDRHPLQMNGSVSLLTTSFDAHGPAALVAEYLTGVTRWLSAPKFDELDRERNVLRAEAELRANATSRALGWRYGARGPGVVAYAEPALGAATPDLLAWRATSIFTRGNAVLALDGPPPPDLHLDLAEGGLLPARAADPIEKSPAAYVEESGLVVSGVVRRSSAATLVPDLVQRVLTDRLRHQTGSSYAPWATYESVDETQAVVVAGADVLQQARGNLAGNLWGMLQRLAHNGAMGTHLTDALAMRRQALHDPYAAYGVAIRAAHAVINGREPESFEALGAELDATSADEVQEALAEFHGTCLVGLPGDTTWTEQWPMVKQPSGASRLRGRRFRSVGWPGTKDELIVGGEGVELRSGGQAQTYALADLEAVLAFADGGRHLIRNDGYGIAVEPVLWRDGVKAVEALDALVPPELRLPHPHREPPVKVETRGWLRRWGGFVLGGLFRPGLLFGGLVLLIVGVLLAAEAALIGLVVYVSEHPDSELAERTPTGVVGFMIAFLAVLIVVVIDQSIDAWRDADQG